MYSIHNISRSLNLSQVDPRHDSCNNVTIFQVTVVPKTTITLTNSVVIHIVLGTVLNNEKTKNAH